MISKLISKLGYTRFIALSFIPVRNELIDMVPADFLENRGMDKFY